MGGVEFKIDSQNNKAQYSIDGGANWLNFSSGVERAPDIIVNTSSNVSGLIVGHKYFAIWASNGYTYNNFTLPSDSINLLALAPTNPEYMYTAARNNIYAEGGAFTFTAEATSHNFGTALPSNLCFALWDLSA